MTEHIVLYGNLTCPMVPPVRSLLKRAGTEFEYASGLDFAGKMVQPGKCQCADAGLP